MARTRKPKIAAMPILYAGQFIATRKFLRYINEGEPDEVITTKSPQAMDNIMTVWENKNKSKKPEERGYWIIKFIPVAVVRRSYEQDRLPEAATVKTKTTASA